MTVVNILIHILLFPLSNSEMYFSVLFRSLLRKCYIQKEQIFINDHEQFGKQKNLLFGKSTVKLNTMPELATVHWLLLHAYWNSWSERT
jgi:hypothetical protein